MSVDGTDFLLHEPKLFDNSRLSCEFRRPDVHYELRFPIEFPEIVWASAPWTCGSHSDLCMFREGFKKLLGENEFVFADNRCPEESIIQPTGSAYSPRIIRALIREPHEILNERLKNLNY